METIDELRRDSQLVACGGDEDAANGVVARKGFAGCAASDLVKGERCYGEELWVVQEGGRSARWDEVATWVAM